MRRIALFGEDSAHRKIIGALVQRLADDFDVAVTLEWRNASRGHGKVASGLRQYLKDIEAQPGDRPDLIVVATDANCRGVNARLRELDRQRGSAPITFAVPDPHIERWLLLDSQAFGAVFGRGCDAPDHKCDRDRYKHQLERAIRHAKPQLELLTRGIEFAEEIVNAIDIQRASNADPSFRRFVNDIRGVFRTWQQ